MAIFPSSSPFLADKSHVNTDQQQNRNARHRDEEHRVAQDAVTGVGNPTGVVLNDGMARTGETLEELKQEGLAGQHLW